MSNQIQEKCIGELLPNDRHLTLTFQICEIIHSTAEALHCRIVDERGIVNALFDKYPDKLKPGEVYSMTNLRVKIVDGHIQIRMTKDTTVEHLPITFGFKDKANDLSSKTFAPKREVQGLNQTYQTSLYSQNHRSQQNSALYKGNSNRQPPDRQSNNRGQRGLGWRQPANSQKQKYKLKEDSKVDFTQSTDLSEYNRKPKMERPKIRYKQKQAVGQNVYPYTGQVRLNEALNQVGNHINVCVWVASNKRTIFYGGVWRVLVADDSGSLWAQFNENQVLEGGSWYELENMEVFELEEGQILIKQTMLSEARAYLKNKHKVYNLTPIINRLY